ncbi:hypothetical protein [Pseudonocardia sp. ICBG1293]|uniref:hypothetical protein n=1 Tax=Pseudonocardia sp. ICBG1293 TaxID=2844382 RepID=UPI001CCE9F0E|nr:hypothetical protein [Pseudonocardia sp. ICBG1293]
MTGLPPRLVLAAHLSVSAAGPRGRRIGSAPPRARLLEDLSAAAVAAVDRLAAGPCPTDALTHGDDEVAVLLAVLWRGGLLADADVEDRVRRRRQSTLVEVRGDDALAVGVVTGLAMAGIGQLSPQVSGVTGADDIPAGLPVGPGRDRGARLRAFLRDGGVDTDPPRRVPADLVVLVGDGPVPPEGPVEHLFVTLRDGCGVVGPLVLPGRGPCAACAGVPGAARGRSSAAPHVLVATAAVAVGQVLAAVDGPVRGGRPPASWGAALELDPEAATVVTRPGFVRPGCPCGTATAGVPDGAPGSTAPCATPPPGWTITV